MFLSFLLALAQAATPKPIESLPPLVQDAQAVSPDHNRIAVSTRDEGVWVIDIATKTMVFRVPPTSSVVEYVTWNEKGSSLGLLHRNADIDIVDARSGAVTATMHSTSKNPVEWEKREIHFAAGGTVIVAALGGPPTDLFSIASAERIAQIEDADGSVTTAITLSPDGSCLALGTDAGVVRTWNARTGQRLDGEARVSNEKRVDNGSDWMGFRGIHSLAFDPSGCLLAIGGGDCDAYLWCRKQKRITRTFPHCDVEMFSTQGIGSVGFNADGTRLLTTSFPFWDMRVWDLGSDRLLDRFEFYSYAAPLPAWFSSDGGRIVCSSDAVGRSFDELNPIERGNIGGTFAKPLPRVPPSQLVWWRHTGDYAWAVVDHHLVVRKIPEAEPVLRIAVREK